MLEGMQTLQFRTPSCSSTWRGSPELSVTVECQDGQSVFKNTCVHACVHTCIYMRGGVRAYACMCVSISFLLLW